MGCQIVLIVSLDCDWLNQLAKLIDFTVSLLEKWSLASSVKQRLCQIILHINEFEKFKRWIHPSFFKNKLVTKVRILNDFCEHFLSTSKKKKKCKLISEFNAKNPFSLSIYLVSVFVLTQKIWFISETNNAAFVRPLCKFCFICFGRCLPRREYMSFWTTSKFFFLAENIYLYQTVRKPSCIPALVRFCLVHKYIG